MQYLRLTKQLLAVGAMNLFAAGMLAAAPSDESIDESVRRAMETFNTPGMAVSVVHDGVLFHSAGYGSVEIGSSRRVDDRTLFQIGSVSKAFTSAALAILADEGKLSWDDRVIDHLPEFRLHDPWVTREFTIRDLLTHRSGLPLGAGDLHVSQDRQAAADEVVAEAWASRNAESTPSLPLEEYTGTYRDPWYGDIEISLEDGKLWFRSERNEPLQGPLEHFQYDTFVARWTDRRLMADAYVTFSLKHDGSIERIRMQAVSPATDFSYDFHDLDLRPVGTR